LNDPAQLLLRFAHYAVLLGLFGLTAFRAIEMRGLGLPNRPMRMVVAVAIGSAMLSTALFLASIAAMMGQQALDVEWSVIEAMLLTTATGWAFVIRCALLLLAIVPVLLGAWWQRGYSVAALLYAGALLTLPWSGHAAASEGGLGLLHRLNDGIHLLVACYWVGAIGWFSILAIRAHRGTGTLPLRQLLCIMHGFRPVGLALVAVVTLTGIFNAQFVFGLASSAAVLGTPYGQLLAVKIVLVAAMIAFASRHAGLARQRDVLDGHVLAKVRGSLTAELATARQSWPSCNCMSVRQLPSRVTFSKP
jgi:copper resistance protein D